MSSNHKQILEKNLATLAKRKYCLLVSRGATALYLSYCSLQKIAGGKKTSELKNKIILPAIMCHSPANVALYAHLDIIFCDVTESDYTLDPYCLTKILEKTSGVLAVLSVNIFGHAPDMGKIYEICKEFNVALIDDAAQSIGGTAAGRPMGGWGEIGIFSFGHTKVIDVGWGGAILTDNEAIYKDCYNTYEALPGPSESIQELRSVYSETYYNVERLNHKSSLLSPLFWPFPEIFRDLYIYKIECPESKILQVSEKLKLLKENVNKRLQYWVLYRSNLNTNENIKFPSLREGNNPWRFTFRINKEKRDLIVSELRSKNIDVSTWYPSLKNRFNPDNSLSGDDCIIAEAIGEEIINLWVDPEKTNQEQIKNTCLLINELINK